MKTVQIQNVPFAVSQICLGTAYLGSRESDELSFQIMDYYFDHGGRFLNTAHEYGKGQSERCIGDWLRQRKNRDKLVITSKCGEDNSAPNCLAMRRADLWEDIDESLSRLGTDYLDFYLLHLDDKSVEVEEIVSTMEDIRRSGKIRYYGCSNWDPSRQRQAAAYAEAHGIPGFVIDEIEHNLTRKNIPNEGSTGKWLDESFIALHEEDGVCVGSYSALSHGVFSKYIRDGGFQNLSEYDIRHYYNANTEEIARRIQTLCKETGWTASQIQLAWQASSPYSFPCFSIIGASKLYQLEDAMAASDLTLSPDMVSYLRPDPAPLELNGKYL